MRVSLLLLILFLLGTPMVNAEEQVLFSFDDHAFPWRDNLHVALVPGEKHADNPVLRCGPPDAPDHGHAILYGSVFQEGGKFRMWYLGMSQRELVRGQAPGYWRPMCYAESEDGVHWRKPELGLVEFNGSRRNNICLIESDPPSLSRVDDFLTVLHEPGEPDPQRRYKCAFIAHVPIEEVRGGRSRIGPNESRWCSFVCATSADGLRWKVVGDRPANNGGERFEVSGLYRFGNFYYAPGQLISPWAWLPDGRAAGRVMLTYRSADFTRWSSAKAFSFARPGQLAEPPVSGQQAHMGAGIWNRGNVLLGLYGMWQDGPKEKPKGASHLFGTRIDLGLVVSNDGVHFREPAPGFKMIPRGADGQWDSIALLQGHAFANVGEKTYVWYSHWDCEGQFRSQEIGLATWRRDRFGGLLLHEKKADGHGVSRTIKTGAKAPRVFVNASGATAEKPLTIELLDDRDQPLPGFTALLAQDTLRGEAAWTKAADQSWPAGKDISVRVTFPAESEARLFALYVSDE